MKKILVVRKIAVPLQCIILLTHETMKKVIALFAAFAVAIAAFAQTPEEIAIKMNEAIQKHSDNGLRMTLDIKIPVMGTISTTSYILGEKIRTESKMMGQKIVTRMDMDTNWTYIPKENTIHIMDWELNKKTKEQESMKMFEKDTDGYDIFLNKETDTAWYLQYKKKKSNKDKDAPKTMDFVVAKGTYYPISMSTKVKGFTFTMRDLKFNVTEKQVTFNKADYPGVTIIDERK